MENKIKGTLQGLNGLKSLYVTCVQFKKIHFQLLLNCIFRYDEVCKPGYNFVDGGFSGSTGHFTQVVWKDSLSLGIGQGKATHDGMQCTYVVGRYKTAGNIPGKFQDEVPMGNFNNAYCSNL